MPRLLNEHAEDRPHALRPRHCHGDKCKINIMRSRVVMSVNTGGLGQCLWADPTDKVPSRICPTLKTCWTLSLGCL